MNDELAQAAQMEAVKKMILQKFLDKAALERLSMVKIANAVLAAQLEAYLVQLYQSGQIKEVITDAKLRQILDVLVEKPKRPMIKRK